PFRKELDLKLVMQANAGPAAARNTGAVHAKGEFLAFTDDDCTPAPGWLQALARFATSHDCAIGGRTVNALPNNPYATTSHLLIDFIYAYFNVDGKQGRFFASNNFALPADSFRANGGFNTTFRTSEDRELCERWLEQGYRMIYAPEALVYHAHPLTFRTFWLRHFSYGRGAFRFHQARKVTVKDLLTPDPLRFYLGLHRYSFSLVRGWRILLIAPLLLVSHAAYVAGFFSERITRANHPVISQGQSPA
ncbi:MAG: glycosyltransferase family 2 protein, partial [Acidiferrobacterales bacterium]